MKISNKMPFKSRWTYKILVTNVALLMILGCSSPKNIIEIHGSDNLNNGGHAVVVSIYQLRNNINFQRATIESFWQDSDSIFEDDIVEQKIEITLIPNETVLVELHISDETNYIGAAADFRRPDKKGWRQIYPITSKRQKKIHVAVGYDKLVFRNY